MSEFYTKKGWIILSNFVVSAAWARVLVLLLSNYNELQGNDESHQACEELLIPAVKVALWLSLIEMLNALVGFTRSKPIQVFLFSSVRIGVTMIAAPLIPCNAWQAVMTYAAWSFGDMVRFGCFGIDNLFPGGRMAKSIRYTVGPILFPIGAGGEMLMVMRIASEGRPKAYLAAALWPVGFYPLISQLLKQRRKHFTPKKEKVIKSV